ncbi:hypothetical protein IQ07DRAFT_563133 [Pyrenochaeta sp. DS3sAY3a]|nr:hypothetical protein IQ07DRAFT_563133 [Pyrenochaeta sp. DS3sAY3a]
MEFLKTCTTNAQAIGDFEAISYQAFSISRIPSQPSVPLRDWNPSDDIRAVEADLRMRLHLVVPDTSRPWLWLFQPTTVEKATQSPLDLPDVDGYTLQRELSGTFKALDLARPPMRNIHPNLASSSNIATPTSASHKGFPAGVTRPGQGNIQPTATDPPQPPDYSLLYELFTSSVTALVLLHLVRNRNVVALNYRTFVSKSLTLEHHDQPKPVASEGLHWLTSINVYWTSSGTLLVSTFTDQNTDIRCVDDVTSPDEQDQLVGRCVRVAPNGSLAKISSFEDPLEAILDDNSHRQRKRARITTLEQNIEKWKTSVKRWLDWKGYSIRNLDRTSSWVRIRTTQSPQSVAQSPAGVNFERDILWPRALCFFYVSESLETTLRKSHTISSDSPYDASKWFETPDSTGFRDPLDVAQEWFLGKPDRDKILEARRKAKKIEEDVARRKEEQPGLLASSPLNARSGVYGDLQAVGGVYPTPPDGVVPGTTVSYADTPSVSGALPNVILAPGGNNPAINLSGPQENTHLEQVPLTSPTFPLTSDNFNTSSGNDDLFEDMEEDGFGAAGVNDADFDFFDGPDDEDVVMLDTPAQPEGKVTVIKDSNDVEAIALSDPPMKEEISDPLAALENALAAPIRPAEEDTQKIEVQSEQSQIFSMPEISDTTTTKSMRSKSKARTQVPREPTPPLSPHMIVKVLQPSPPKKDPSQNSSSNTLAIHHDSAFDPVNFSRKMSISDARYQDGRFSAHREKDVVDTSRSNPTKVKSLRDIPLLTKLRYAIGVASANKIPEITALARAYSDDSDSSSESSDESEEEFDHEVVSGPVGIVGGIILPAKRKLPTEGNATPLSVTSFADSFAGDWQDFHGLQFDEALLTQFEPNTWDWSLVRFSSPTEKAPSAARFNMPALPSSLSDMPDTPTSQSEFSVDFSEERPLSGKDSIAITQIVTDQIVSATLDLLREDFLIEPISTPFTSLESRWLAVVTEVFPEAVNCDVPALAAIHDCYPDLSTQARGQQRPPPRKINESTIPGSQMYQISAPYLRVRRADTQWDLLPPALAFWEPLGLSPISAHKNVVAFCIYPHSESLRPCLENFLVNLQLAYDGCKLGSYARVETVREFEGGLVPYKVTSPPTRRDAIKALRETCIQLGKLLAIQHAKIREQHDAKIDAFVIYMVDPFGDASALWELCSAFWMLFQTYGQGPPGRPDQPQKPDLVLQVVPMKYVASFDVPVILDPSAYAKLAREVYDRCPPSAPSGDKTSLNIYSAPAFQLEETLPRSVPFKLISEPALDLLRENCYMHVAYAISQDGTWITAAWTDTCGKSQAVVSYHLGTRVFGEIAKEIWQTTIDILQSRRVHWRVCVAKAGVMEREEFETWVMLIQCPTQINLFITLLTVDTEPTIKLTPSMPSTSNASGQGSANTPGSTPQAGVSPDPAVGLTPAATPSADPSASDPAADPEARLIDVTDETWGVIFAHRLHNSNSTNQFSPAMISSLLVKRGETFATSNTINQTVPDPEHGPIVIAVNILWIGAVGSTRAATSPFPPSGPGDGVSPGGAAANPSAAYTGTNSAPPSPSPVQDGGPRSASSLMWTPTPQTRGTAENLLKEVLAHYRALGLLAKLRGMRGTRHGSVPWHVAAVKRGVLGLGRVMGGG